MTEYVTRGDPNPADSKVNSISGDERQHLNQQNVQLVTLVVWDSKQRSQIDSLSHAARQPCNSINTKDCKFHYWSEQNEVSTR